MSKRSGSSIGDGAKKGAKRQKQSSLSGFFKSSSSSSTSSSSLTSKKRSDDESKASSENGSSSFPYKIFCDLDGVLVDFDAGVRKLFNGKGPDDIPNQGIMWSAIHRANDFYATLPWTSDGKDLWDVIKSYNPDILTGVPNSLKSRGEKAAWCRKELGKDVVNHVDMAGKKKAHDVVAGRKRDDRVNVITCWSRNKHCESGKNHILIDDRESLAEQWERSGGIFIHHTSTKRTIELLKKRGILSSPQTVKGEKKPIDIKESKTGALYDVPPDTP